ncbi:hypothetical protein F4774DRAFT_368457 [Daldinia eschscholtzii]|nr:hypothetical protein F4774DRAFT_368457 [Daldinia eschscholtzii]
MWNSIKAAIDAVLPRENPLPEPLPPLPQHQGKSRNPRRAVFLGTWGMMPGGVAASVNRAAERGPGRSVSFHQVILITDGTTRETIVSRKTEATIIDWGMHTEPGARAKPFSYDEQADRGNTYQFVGETYWTNGQIKSLVSKLGYQYAQYDDSMTLTNKYDWNNNNCRHMAVDTILAITKFPTPDNDSQDFVESVAAVLLTDKKIMAWHVHRIMAINDMDGTAAADINTVNISIRSQLEDLEESGELQILEPSKWGIDQWRTT